MRSDNRPDEKSDTGRRDKVRFDREEMANLMHREPDCWQATNPEEKEADKVHCVCSRAYGKAIGDIFIRGPDGTDHECDAFA